MKRPPLTAPLNGTAQRNVFRGGVLYVNGAADLLNTTPKAIRAKVALRRLPFHKLNGRVIFFREELQDFLTDLPGCSVEEARRPS